MKSVRDLTSMLETLKATIGLVECGAARLLLEHDAITAREMADALGCSQPAAEMRLVKAHRAGALDRGAPAGKKRPMSYWLTDRGRRLVA